MISEQPELEGVQFTPEAPLKTTKSQYLKLYERLSEDREAFTKQLSKLEDFSLRLEKQIRGFNTLESEVRHQLINSIQTEVKNATESIGKEIKASAYSALDKTAALLKQTAHDTAKALEAYRAQSRPSWIETTAFALIASVLSSIIIVEWLMPTPVWPVSKPDMTAFESGIILEEIWKDTSDNTKKELTALAQQKLNKNIPLPLLEGKVGN